MQADATDKTFKDFYLSDEMQRALERIEYTRPTPVQEDSIPLILAGIDLIVQSQTGTGKTAAFGIPIVEMLEPEPGTVEVLILAPTRELAKQVSEEFARLAHFKKAQATAIYGGTGYESQIEALKTSQIVCATPGRLLDLLKQGKADLSKLRFFILDEADEMLSMGFERELNDIISFLPEERQSLLFSATVTEDIKALARNMLFYPEYLSFSSDSVINKDVTHTYTRVDGVSRMRDLIKLIEFEDPENAIVFANTKNDTFLVTSFLKRHGYRAEVLNGDLAQKEREKTLGLLRDGEINFLVATDVAARGIDISDLTHVINFLLPDDPDVYVHRTGRTGRAGKKGTAMSMISSGELATFIQVKKRTGLDIIELPLPTTLEILEAKRGRAAGKIAKRVGAVKSLAYTSKLDVARDILSQGTEEERVELVARLLALAERALDRKPAPAPAPVVVEAKAEEQAEEAPAKAEVKAEAKTEAKADEADEARTERDEERRSRRSRRSSRSRSSRRSAPSRRRDEEPAEAKAEEATEEAQETEQREEPRSRRRGGRGRRGRGRGRGSDSGSTEQTSAPTEEAPKQEGEDRRSQSSRRSSRSRGRGRGRSGESRSGESRSSENRPSESRSSEPRNERSSRRSSGSNEERSGRSSRSSRSAGQARAQGSRQAGAQAGRSGLRDGQAPAELQGGRVQRQRRVARVPRVHVRHGQRGLRDHPHQRWKGERGGPPGLPLRHRRCTE